MAESSDDAGATAGQPLLLRWAKGLALAISPLFLAWAVAYFSPSAWYQVQRLWGVPSLEASVLLQDQFDSGFAAAYARNEWIHRGRLADITQESLRDPRGSGGSEANSTLIRVVLRGNFSQQATIHRIVVRVVKREQPIRGVFITSDFGAPGEVRFVHLDLDKETVNWLDSRGKPIAPMTLIVDQDEDEIVDFLATASDGNFEWQLEFIYTVEGGEPQSLTLGHPDGNPFRTSSTDAAAEYNVSTERCEESPVPGEPLCP